MRLICYHGSKENTFEVLDSPGVVFTEMLKLRWVYRVKYLKIKILMTIKTEKLHVLIGNHYSLLQVII